METLPSVRIVFDQERLHETVEALREVTGASGSPVASATASDNFNEALWLEAVAKERFGAGHFIQVESRLISAGGTHETRVRLAPSQRLLEHLAAFRLRRIGADEREIPVVSHGEQDGRLGT